MKTILTILAVAILFTGCSTGPDEATTGADSTAVAVDTLCVDSTKCCKDTTVTVVADSTAK